MCRKHEGEEKWWRRWKKEKIEKGREKETVKGIKEKRGGKDEKKKKEN